MPRKEDISHFINEKSGLFTILNDAGIKKNSRYVLCQCDCGTIKEVRLSDLKNGSSTNCGCVRKKYLKDKNTSHNLSKHPLNRVWRGILERCYDSKHQAYHAYGERGITVCDEWRNDFINFYNWAILNGWQKGLQVDRYPDKDGNYAPENCRITSSLQNNRNKRSNRILEFNGESKCMSEWAEILGISQDAIKDRLNKLGWSVEKALSTPIKL